MFTSSAARLRNISDWTERSVIMGSCTDIHRLTGSNSFNSFWKDDRDWKSGVENIGSSVCREEADEA
jgi:hypothetical protein